MPLATPFQARDNKSLLSVAGGPGASGTDGTKKRKKKIFVDGLLHSSPKRRQSHSSSGSGHCHYPSHPGWALLPPQWQWVNIVKQWVILNGQWVRMTNQWVGKNVSTPVNQPQWMLLNNTI
eukprot:scaffold21416_cov73-Skeletonema_marinoi.AAC.1